MGEEKTPVHAAAIKSKGDWIPGVIDPASRGRSQVDGERLYRLYADPPPDGQGLTLYPADNTLEAGVLEVWTRMSEGRLKIFRGLSNLMRELRTYQRKRVGQIGKIVKENDHACDCMRYLVMSGLAVAQTNPSGNYDDFIGKLEAAGDGYRRGIEALKHGRSGVSLAETYH
jgi:hypothetical protein